MTSGANPTFLLPLRTHFRKHFITFSSGEGNSYPDWWKEHWTIHQRGIWLSQNPASHESTARAAAAVPLPSSTKGSRGLGDAHSGSLSKAPIQPTIQKSTLRRKEPFPRPNVPGTYAEVAAGLTRAYCGSGLPRGDPQPGVANSPKPPLSHLSGAVSAAPAGSSRCNNDPNTPASLNRSGARNSAKDPPDHWPKIVISPAITVPPKKLRMTVPDVRHRPHAARQPRAPLGNVVLLLWRGPRSYISDQRKDFLYREDAGMRAPIQPLPGAPEPPSHATDYRAN